MCSWVGSLYLSVPCSSGSAYSLWLYFVGIVSYSCHSIRQLSLFFVYATTIWLMRSLGQHKDQTRFRLSFLLPSSWFLQFVFIVVCWFLYSAPTCGIKEKIKINPKLWNRWRFSVYLATTNIAMPRVIKLVSKLLCLKNRKKWFNWMMGRMQWPNIAIIWDRKFTFFNNSFYKTLMSAKK